MVLLLSGGSYVGFVLFFSVHCVTCSPPTNPVGVEILQMSQPLFYIVCALTTVTALIPRYTQTHTPASSVPRLFQSSKCCGEISPPTFIFGLIAVFQWRLSDNEIMSLSSQDLFIIFVISSHFFPDNDVINWRTCKIVMSAEQEYPDHIFHQLGPNRLKYLSASLLLMTNMLVCVIKCGRNLEKQKSYYMNWLSQ